MRYINNQYIKIKETIEEIGNKEYKFTYNYNDKIPNIEDLELIEEPNIILYMNRTDGSEFINIYRSVRIMITTYWTLYDKFDNLPENIETIIIIDESGYNKKNIILENKEINMMFLMSNTVLINFIKKMIQEEKYDVYNDKDETLLFWLCRRNITENTMELIEKMSEEMINKLNKDDYYYEELNKEKIIGESALYWACVNRNEEIALKILEKTKDNTLNAISWSNENLLICVCQRKLTKIALQIIPRMNSKRINETEIIWNSNLSKTALIYACENNMECVAIELIKLMNPASINKRIILNSLNNTYKTDVLTALTIAKHNNMYKTVNYILCKLTGRRL